MARPDLTSMNRADLIGFARRAGVGRAEVLTRAELVDEITKREVTDPAQRKKARGLLGRARDLIASVIERGLHLPETAEKLRGVPLPNIPPQPEPVATVTLAEIYAAQGHRERARLILDEVLAQEPDHAVALALRARFAARTAAADVSRMDSAGGTVKQAGGEAVEQIALKVSDHGGGALSASPPTEPPAPASQVAVASETTTSDRPIPMLDDVPLPRAYGVDECVVLPVDPTTAYVYWEVRPATVARAQQDAPHGRLIIRVTGRGERGSFTRDIPADVSSGDYFLFGLPAGSQLESQLGWLRGDELDALAPSSSAAAPEATAREQVASVVVSWSPRTAAPRAVTAPPAGVLTAIAIEAARDDATAARRSVAPSGVESPEVSSPAGSPARSPEGSSWSTPERRLEPAPEQRWASGPVDAVA